jgi:hypothetical protein
VPQITYVGSPTFLVVPVRNGRGYKLTISQVAMVPGDDASALEVERFTGHYQTPAHAFEAARDWLLCAVII